MIAFDAELFRGTRKHVDRAALIPPDQQVITIVVVEEILRGRLNIIRAKPNRAEPESPSTVHKFLARSAANKFCSPVRTWVNRAACGPNKASGTSVAPALDGGLWPRTAEVP
jgi:hypothetical protein